MVDTIYAVFEFEESSEETSAQVVFSGCVYSSEALAADHASRVWGGSYRAIEVFDTLPQGITDLSKGRL